jgi:AcrR family transcriptional regulator
MAKHRIDRRVARTRATLQDALISLILEKGYDAVTVEDICATANVGRSTFYSHFSGKDDLKRSGLEDLHRQLLHRQREAHTIPAESGHHRFGFSLSLFEHAREHRELYRALAGGRGSAVSLASIRKMLADLVRGELAASAKAGSIDSIPREIVVQYVVGAYLAVLTWWLDGGAKLPPQRIDEVFRRLATEGIPSAQPPKI